MKILPESNTDNTTKPKTDPRPSKNSTIAKQFKSDSSQEIIQRDAPAKLSRWEILDRVELLRQNGGQLKFGGPIKKVVPEAVSSDLLLKSDIAANDPKDPTTVGKLKDILNNGGINFSQKEQSVLSKIL